MTADTVTTAATLDPYCLGALLARAEMAEALPILARRLPGLELAGEPSFRPDLSGMVGPEALPIPFQRRA